MKSPGFGDRRKSMLEDLAILTGGQVISEELGIKLENVTINDLGSCKKVRIDKEDTTIVGGSGQSSDVQARCEQIKTQIDTTTSDYDKENFKKGWRNFQVELQSLMLVDPPKLKLKKEKTELTMLSQQQELQLKELFGWRNSSSLFNKKSIENLKGSNSDQDAGIDIIRKALESPVRQITENAGVEGSIVIGKLLELSGFKSWF